MSLVPARPRRAAVASRAAPGGARREPLSEPRARRTRQTAAVALLAAGALALGLAAPARASVEPIDPIVTHTLEVKQDRKGVLVTNNPYGYYTGRLFASDTVTELYATHSRIYTYDRITQVRRGRQLTQCGWIETVVLQKGTEEPAQGSRCSDPHATIERESVGREFNCAPSVCIDGAATYVSARCDDRAYYNRLAQASSPAEFQAAGTPEGFYDYAGQINPRIPVYYRYTTLDAQAAVVRSRQYGWVFISRDCIIGYPQGGTPKPLPLALAGPMISGRARSLQREAQALARRSGAVIGRIAAAFARLTAAL